MKTDTFWTFLVTGIKVNTVTGLSQLLEVTGSFAHVKIETPETPKELEESNDPIIAVHPLTAEDITLTLPIDTLTARGDKPINPFDVSASNVFDLFSSMFADLPFKRIPKAPSDLPVHKVPPSRRPAFLEAMKNLR